MLSTWTTFQDKENSSTAFQPSSKARATGTANSSKLEMMSKKKVFGDLGNTIRTLDNNREMLGSLKTPAKTTGAISKYDVNARKSHVWPEPESLPTCTDIEDDYEDCWPMHLRFSEKGLQELTRYRGKGKKPMARSIPESPLSAKPSYEPDEIDLELFMEPVFEEILPPFWD